MRLRDPNEATLYRVPATLCPGGVSLSLLLVGVLGAGCRSGAPPAFTSSSSTTVTTSSQADTSTETSSPTTGTSGGTTGTSTSSSSLGTTATSSSTSSRPLKDVGWDTEDASDTTPLGCKGKIDFLFVISRFFPLEPIQGRLVDAYPKFIEIIESKFADFDYHIMVIDADDYWGIPPCPALCSVPECKTGDPCCPWYHPENEGQVCCSEDFPCDKLDFVTACDDTLGAGVVFPVGSDSSNAICKIADGRRYMTKTQPNLAETFACAAQLGISGSNRVGDALVAAMSPALNEPGGCNEGFLRDDALLMITMVSPSGDHSKSVIYPWDWYDAIVEAKNGDASSVLALNFTQADCDPLDNYPCQLTEMFTEHLLADKLTPDYGPVFDKATDLVQEMCEPMIPE